MKMFFHYLNSVKNNITFYKIIPDFTEWHAKKRFHCNRFHLNTKNVKLVKSHFQWPGVQTRKKTSVIVHRIIPGRNLKSFEVFDGMNGKNKLNLTGWQYYESAGIRNFLLPD